MPSDVYIYARYASEIILYLLLIKALLIGAKNKKLDSWKKNPLFKWIILFIGIGLFSALLNFENITVAILGLRQILRMAVLLFIFIGFKFSKKQIKIFIIIFIGVIIFEALLGITQYISGGVMDEFLLSSSNVVLGEKYLLSGISYDWAGGVRSFATLGRYERFGIFMLMGLLFFLGYLYLFKKNRKLYLAGFIITSLAVIFSYTRSVWITGFFLIPLVLYLFFKNKKAVYFFGALLILFIIYINIYLVITNTALSQYIDSSGSSLSARLVQSFSYQNLKNSYNTAGRIYFWVETPKKVLTNAPLFGFGPGMYGSGVTSSLEIRDVYSRLNMPYGVKNQTGMVDSNWMSILGEFGIMGVAIIAIILFLIIKNSLNHFKQTDNKLIKLVCFIVGGMSISYFILGMFWPIFEYRVINFYFWFFVGLMFFLTNNKKSVNLLG
ncbi:MAG: O-antigen ligase family protein [Patescibacteria group bacterium]